MSMEHIIWISLGFFELLFRLIRAKIAFANESKSCHYRPAKHWQEYAF